MDITVKLKTIRISPRKVRLIADLVRGKKALEAVNILTFKINKSAEPMLKLLKSAIANAKHNHQIAAEDLFISKLTVDAGVTLKRSRPRSRGSAFPIAKRTSHINLTLSPVEKKEVKKNNK